MAMPLQPLSGHIALAHAGSEFHSGNEAYAGGEVGCAFRGRATTSEARKTTNTLSVNSL